ncbi:hypothetical protein PIROE2DRAFT_3317 [Piromyces sp. E2]|nr:hypothetical protein PIROE2DRAFT_3317 [Piromyces sp. E2]|eukprot:OUM68927.1 hypothetical protein PIROE2DRAFT_3317 [Piromyces sp. E2]
MVKGFKVLTFLYTTPFPTPFTTFTRRSGQIAFCTFSFPKKFNFPNDLTRSATPVKKFTFPPKYKFQKSDREFFGSV